MLEILAGRVAIAALELVAVGKRKRVHDEIERTPFIRDRLEHALDALQVFHIGFDDDLGADGFGERDGAPSERSALIGEGKLGALTVQHPGDAPGDRTVVGDAHHQPSLSGHQRRGLSDIFRCSHDAYSAYFQFTLFHGLSRRTGGRPAWRWCRRSRSCWTSRVDGDMILAFAQDRHVGDRRVDGLDVGGTRK